MTIKHFIYLFLIFPNSVILNFSKNTISNSSEYWIHRYVMNFKINSFFFNNYCFHQTFLNKKSNLMLGKKFKDNKKFTFYYSDSINYKFLNIKNKNFLSKIFKLEYKIKNIKHFSKNWSKEANRYFFNKNKINDVLLMRTWENFTNKMTKNTNIKKRKPNNLWNFFNIYFLKKEKIYTKLKYSRVPQYDIVSGGVAALFAGFLGFLICEKFGFELLDSGDFYFIFLYLVFFFFFFKLIIKLISFEINFYNIFSLKPFFIFYSNLFSYFFKFF
uniref:Ycf20 n=1 Tax=Paraurostyla sp. TaxID=6014 RepID=A0A3Q8C549_9STIC|nr:hypothetical protein [Paraurostyla sp.]